MRSMILGIAMFGGVFATTLSASATTCQNTNSRQCWAIPSNANYSQLAVGRTPAGVGIACAIRTERGRELPNLPNGEWGGNVHCFSAVGTSGVALTGRAGHDIQPSGWFDALNPSKRIVSLDIEPGPTSNQVVIRALRSDGLTFNASTIWPKGPDPSIFFAPDIQTPPATFRSIAFVSGYGHVATDTSNRQWLQSGFQWLNVSGNIVFVAGNQVGTGDSMALFGTTGTSLSIVPFSVATAPPNLPGQLALATSNPNSSFDTTFGRSNPMGIGARDAWATLTGNTATVCPGQTACILRSLKNSSGTWGVWFAAPTGNDPTIKDVTTVQDGASMRGARGEVWVIHGPQRLAFYAP